MKSNDFMIKSIMHGMMIIYTSEMLQKVVKGNDRFARINPPTSWLGYNMLIIESPDD